MYCNIINNSGSSREEKELTGVAKKSLQSVNVFLTVPFSYGDDKQIIDASIPLTYLSREVIRTTVSLAQENHANLLFALNKVDLIKQKSLIQERKQLIMKEVPQALRSSV